MIYHLTTRFSGFTLEPLAVTRPLARKSNPGGGCLDQPLSFPIEVGVVPSKSPIPKTKIENRWPSCIFQHGTEWNSTESCSKVRATSCPDDPRPAQLLGIAARFGWMMRLCWLRPKTNALPKVQGYKGRVPKSKKKKDNSL
jgi:hypothetical protein